MYRKIVRETKLCVDRELNADFQMTEPTRAKINDLFLKMRRVQESILSQTENTYD